MTDVEENQTLNDNHIKSSLREIVEDIDKIYHEGNTGLGLNTGLSDFDTLTGGLHSSNLIIIAGRPSMGKTTLAINIIENIAIILKKPAILFSLETKPKTLTLRFISSIGRIDSHRICSGNLDDEDWPRVTSAVHIIGDSPIYIENVLGQNIDDICTKAHEMSASIKSIGVIVVDYVQLLCRCGSTPENRTAELSAIIRRLKILAKELDIPVIAISQLNRSLEQRVDKRPLISDLRDSGSIEDDADMICFIYRDDYYNEDSISKGTAEIIVAKHRNGPQGWVRTAYLDKYGRFEDLYLGY